jgi:hypothetical protein
MDLKMLVKFEELHKCINRISTILEQITKRLSCEPNIALASNELVREYQIYEAEFRELPLELQCYKKKALPTLSEIN